MATNPPCICFLTQAFPDFEGAYRGIFVKNLAGYIVSQGYRVVVVTPRIYKTSKKQESEGGLKVCRFFFPSGERPLISYQKIPVLRMSVYMIFCMFKTFDIIIRHSCRLIHVHWIHPNGIIGLIVKTIFQRPLIVHVRGSDFSIFATKNMFFKFLTQLVLRRADRVLCTSESSRSGIIRAFPQVNSEKVAVVYNQIDSSRFRPISENEARRALGIHVSGLCLLFIGNLLPEKGILDLVKVVKSLSDEFQAVSLHIIGTGPLEMALKKEARDEVHNQIIFIHGASPPDRIPLWLNASNLLILPSEREGMPNVILEALHCGIPAVATDVGDIGRFIKDGENGFVIKRDEKAKHLRRILKNLLKEPEQLILMKKRLQDEVDKNKEICEKVCVSIEQIYTSLLTSDTHA